MHQELLVMLVLSIFLINKYKLFIEIPVIALIILLSSLIA